MKDLKKIVSHLILQDCTAREMVFPDLETPDTPQIGDFATDKDGVPLDGLILLPEGDLYKFNKGKLQEILVSNETIAKLSKLSKKNAIELNAMAKNDANKLRKEVAKELSNIKRIIGWAE